MTLPASDTVRSVMVAVLAAMIIALGSAIIIQGRDLVEARTKIEDIEKRLDLITHRVEKFQNP